MPNFLFVNSNDEYIVNIPQEIKAGKYGYAANSFYNSIQQ